MIAGRNTDNLKCVDHTILMAESQELKVFLMRLEEVNCKYCIKLNIKKTKLMTT